ncbi:MAG: acyl-CoA thioesterase, partial [Arenibacter troitsensis]|nr:acyl-CoA thioesterase [Arenibacter troitsensis]
GETIQVFVEDEGGLSLTMPTFFLEWKQKVGLLNE